MILKLEIEHLYSAISMSKTPSTLHRIPAGYFQPLYLSQLLREHYRGAVIMDSTSF